MANHATTPSNIQTTTFKGARYIVKFHNPIEWSATESYEAIESVQHNAFTYISKQPVPAGVQIDNEDFWLLWADPNAQMEELRALVSSYVDTVEELERKIDIDLAHVFDTAANMKISTDLSVGTICHTNGFHTVNDDGAAWYEITDTGTANEMDVIACGELFANLIPDDEIHLAQLGCRENNDIADALTVAFSYGKPINGDGKTYRVLSPIEAPASVCLKNVKIDFNNVCTGLFVRADNTDYKSPLTRLMDYAKFYDCEFFNSIDVNTDGTSSYSAALPIYAKNVDVENCIFRDNACNGLMLYGENANAFKHVAIKDCIAYANGVYDTASSTRSKTGMGIGSYQDVNNFSSDITVIGCTCWDNSNSGIGFHGLNNVKISDCKCTVNHEHGITVQSAINAIISNCVCVNNNIRQIRIQGDWNVSPTYCKNVIVDSCVLNGERAFGIGGGCENIKINNCDITAYANTITFDPMGKWDKKITISNCNMNYYYESTVDKKYSIFADLNANENNVFAYNNIINSIVYPFSGEALNRADVNEPTQMFITSIPYLYGLAEREHTLSTNAVTVSNNEYTTTSGGGFFYTDVNIEDINSYVAFYVEGHYSTISNPSVVINGIRPQARGNTVYDFSNRLSTQACKVVDTKCTYCMIIDINEFKKFLTDSNVIRLRFTVSNVIGDTFVVDDTKVLY